MTTIAKLKEGELKIAGEIEELIDETIQPTFTRASTAYKEDGTVVAANVPRFENGGLKIEEATTNLVPIANQKFEGWSAYNSVVVTLTQNQTVQEWNTTEATRIKSTGGTVTLKYMYSLGTLATGDIRTVHIKVKNVGNYPIRILLNYTESAYVVTNGVLDYVATITGNGGTLYIGFKTTNITDALDVIAYQPQIESKAYSTSFAVGTRPQETLTIPASVLDYREGTIEFDYTPINQPLSDMTTQAKQPKIMQIGTFLSPNSLTLWRFPRSGVDYVSLTGNRIDDTWKLAVGAKYAFPTLNNKCRIAFRWKTANTFDVWIGGLPIITNAISSVPFTTMGNIVFGNTSASGGVNALYSNVRVSSKYLSDTEMAYTGDLSVDEYTTYLLPCKEDLVASSTFYPHFRLSLTGGLKTTSILTEQPTIPSDVYYYPLTFDGKDSTHTFSPSDATNLVYSRDGVWVGTATRNYYTGYTPSVVNGGTQSDVTQTVGEYGFLFEGAKTWKFGRDGTTDQFHGWGGTYNNWISGAIGAGFTSSGYYKTSDSAGVTEIPPLVSYTTDWSTNISSSGNNTGLTVKGDGKWNFYTSSCVLTQASTGANANFPWTDSSQAGTCFYHAQMWEKKPFPSPFCNGSRGAGSLSYNFNSTLGLDWNGDWTICYWKKPVGTRNDTLTSYNFESLGIGGNTVGGGYTFWGRNNAEQNSIYTSGINSNCTTYFNKWHMVSLTKSGASIVFKFWGIDGGVKTMTYNLGTVVSNYYVTQNGADFTFGHATYPCNSYYKDLVVAKRALTDDELFALYKTQIKSYNSGILQVRNGISEGDIF